MFNTILLYIIGIISLKCYEVEEWTDKTFISKLAANGDQAFIKFYAPWCGHCKRLSPIWLDLSKKHSNHSVPIVKIDCTSSGKKTCGKYGISGYPTLKFLSGKDVIDYHGERSFDELSKFYRIKAKVTLRYINVMDVSIIIKPTERSSVVAFIKDKRNDEYKILEKISQELVGAVDFYYTDNEELANELELSENEAYLSIHELLQTKIDIKFEKFKISLQLKQHLLEKMNGLVGYRKKENLNYLKYPYVVVYVDADPKTHRSNFRLIRNRVIKISKRNPDHKFYVSVKSHFEQEIASIHHSMYGISLILWKDKNTKYVMSTLYDIKEMKECIEGIEKFLADYEKGSITPFVKSQAVPKRRTGPVITLVASNFHNDVYENPKDTLILFYAPWCGHCKSFKPVYEKLAKQVKDIQIGQFDATENDIPEGFEVSGFPTLYYVKLGKDLKSHQRIVYRGERELDAILLWLKKQRGTSKTVKSTDSHSDEL